MEYPHIYCVPLGLPHGCARGQARSGGFFAETMNGTLEFPVRKTNPWPESTGRI
jgi:hypothetical protein